MSRAPVTFLSDFGAGSDYVGICHAVIARIAPDARVIDLAHSVPIGDVRTGAHLLARAIPYTEPGVHLAVVDPGVGTERRAVAVGTPEGRVFVGPDNGLLATAVRVGGGAEWARELSRSPFVVKPVSRTFWGRDVFAPVAAALTAGATPDEVGDELAPAELIPGPAREVVAGERELRARIALIDGFGNLALEASWSELAQAGLTEAGVLRGDALHVAAGRRRAVASVGEASYADVDAGAMLVHPDSFGAVEVAMNGDSAAAELDASGGDEVTITARR